MAKEKLCKFKDYLKCKDDKLQTKTRKKMNKKSHKGRYYGGLSQPSLTDLDAGNVGGISGNSGGVGESYTYDESHKRHVPKIRFSNYINSEEDEENISGMSYEEDQEESKKDQARRMYQTLLNSGYSRNQIIAEFKNRLGLTIETAEAYHDRIAREFGGRPDEGPSQMAPGAQGMPGVPGQMGGEMGQGVAGTEEALPEEEPKPEIQEWDDPNRQGEIRTVDGAHLVYKRQTDDGTFEELWVFKSGDKFVDEINIRRDILAGTDIPVDKTQSDDGSQTSELWSVGNVQLMLVSGLPQ